MMASRRRFVSRVLSIGVLITALFVTGCTGIPLNGDVQRSDVRVEAPASDIEFLPASPIPGDGPDGILRGFIDAASSPQNDYAVAREFLTTTLSATWDPTARVIVDDGSREITKSSETTISLITSPEAVVDSAGNYSAKEDYPELSLGYEFTQENGEWRISVAPEGVIVESYTFDQVFGAHALYFFDPTYTLLVPDLRYFPSRASTPTRIMKALLAGPSPWLFDPKAVVSAFPEGTTLVAETVPITGTSASVDITGGAIESSLEDKRRMLRQAAASLSSLSSIFTVQLSIDGVPQDISARAEDVDKGYPQVDARPLVVADNKFGYLKSSGGVDEIPRLSSVVGTYVPWAGAYSSNHFAATLNVDDGLIVVRPTGSTAVLDSRAELAPAVFDYYGFIWSVPRTAPQDLVASTISGVKRLVTTPWPTLGRVISLSLSRDGTRVAALIEVAGTSTLFISGVTRDGQNGPVSLGPALEVPIPAGVPRAAVWVDSLTVAVLTTLADGSPLLTLHVVGGSSRSVTPTAPGTSIAVGNSLSELSMRADDGTLYSFRNGGSWPTIATNIQTQIQLQ